MQELVRGYYNKRAEHEWDRFNRHRIEFAVSQKLLAAHLPGSGRILDCGGGPGRYAIWLAEQGYDVTLFDISEACLQKAETEAGALGIELKYELGTATDLGRFPDAAFDAVLLMGPLYHLQELNERRQAVAEAARVCRAGGLLAASFITRVGVLRYVAKEEAANVLNLYEPMLNVIAQGFDPTFPPADDDHFHAYFAAPSEVEPLLTAAGFTDVKCFAAEGFVAQIDASVSALNGAEWDAWVELNTQLASDSALFSAADHLLAIARRS